MANFKFIPGGGERPTSPAPDTNLRGHSLPGTDAAHRLEPERDLSIPYECNIQFRAVRDGKMSAVPADFISEPSGTGALLPFRRDFSLGGGAAAFLDGIRRWRETQSNEQLAYAMIEAVADILRDHARLYRTPEVAQTIIGAEPRPGHLLMRNLHGAEWILDYRSKGFEDPRTLPRDLLARILPTWGEQELSTAHPHIVHTLKNITGYPIVPRAIPNGDSSPSETPRPTGALIPGTPLGGGLTLALALPSPESSIILSPAVKRYLDIDYRALGALAQSFLAPTTAHLFPANLPTRAAPLWSAVSADGTASATFVRLLLDSRLNGNTDYLIAHPDRDTVVVAHRVGSDLPALAAKVKAAHAIALRPISPHLFTVWGGRVTPAEL